MNLPKSILLTAGAASLALLAGCASTPAPAPEAPVQEETAASDAPEPTMTARVYFLSEPNLKAGTDPVLLYAQRTVSRIRPAHGVMNAMLKGPTQVEKSRGLAFVDSGVTGYHGLRVENGIASITLEGDCHRGESSVTIADLILPTLKQFPTVNHVRIYDANGETQDPNGTGDSIPSCLAH